MILASDRLNNNQKPSTYVPSSLYGMLPGGLSHPTEVKAKLFELELEKEES